MEYLITSAIVLLWLLLSLQLFINHKNIVPVEPRGRYTEESIKAIFVEYWRERFDKAPTIKEKGELLYRASKTDGILDRLFYPPPPVATEARPVQRAADNVVPLRPRD